jgi:hypothetical protein
MMGKPIPELSFCRKRKELKMQIMTKNHRRWREFCHRLAWEMEANRDETESLRGEILANMGFAADEIIASLTYLKEYYPHLTMQDLDGPNWMIYGDLVTSEDYLRKSIIDSFFDYLFRKQGSLGRTQRS